MIRGNLMHNPLFQQFLRDVEQQLEDISPDGSITRAALESELRTLEEHCRGWIQSLSKSSLPEAVRAGIEQEYDQAQKRLKAISLELGALASQVDSKRSAVDPAAVAEALDQLGNILASQNPSAANLMLSQHIEGIYCGPDGRVRVRTCKLGAFAGALDLARQANAGEPQVAVQEPELVASYQAEPRRRTRRNTRGAIEDADVAARLGDFAVDPQRFAGLGPEWFTEDVFQVPRRKSWAEEHAGEVAQFRLQNHASMEVTAEHFGKTVPTIREALSYAKQEDGIDAFGTGVSRRNRPHWARDNADQVAAFLREPDRRLKDAVLHFGKSEPTIRKALSLSAEARQIQSAVQDEGKTTTDEILTAS